MDALIAERKAFELIYARLMEQNEIQLSEHPDTQKGQFFEAALAFIEATYDRRHGIVDAFDDVPMTYPETWTGFRSHGGDIPNIVLIISFLIQELKRLLMAGENPERVSPTPDLRFNPETGLQEAV